MQLLIFLPLPCQSNQSIIIMEGNFIEIIYVIHMIVVFMFVLFLCFFLSGFGLIILKILEYTNSGLFVYLIFVSLSYYAS